MKINPNYINKAYGTQSTITEASKKTKQATKEISQNTDKVVMSQEGLDAQQAGKATKIIVEELNAEYGNRIAQLKEQIASHTYQVDIDAIASSVIEHAKLVGENDGTL